MISQLAKRLQWLGLFLAGLLFTTLFSFGSLGRQPLIAATLAKPSINQVSGNPALVKDDLKPSEPQPAIAPAIRFDEVPPSRSEVFRNLSFYR